MAANDPAAGAGSGRRPVSPRRSRAASLSQPCPTPPQPQSMRGRNQQQLMLRRLRALDLSGSLLESSSPNSPPPRGRHFPPSNALDQRKQLLVSPVPLQLMMPSPPSTPSRLLLSPNSASRGMGTPPPSTPIRRQLHYDPNLLAPPSVHELGLTRGEPSPHKRDTVERIPIRARSQSWLIRTRHLLDDEKLTRQVPIISKCLFLLSVLLLLLTFPFCIPFCLRVSKEYERAVVFRLGRLIKRGTKGPGMFFIMPCIDTYKMVDLRVLSFDVPPQEILSRDTVTVSVEAVIYFRISNPVISVTNVNDAQFSTKLLAQTTLRNVLGTKTLSEILLERDVISSVLEKVLDDGTDPWGVKVERVEIKDIRLPQMLMKSMAAEAEAARDARAKIIAADGERSASRQLVEAADVVCGNKVSLQLRYLQTLIRISSQYNHTYVIPIPLEVVKRVLHNLKKRS